MDKFVCHRCDNPACCNPDHLYLGTAADNAADRQARQRGRGAAHAPAHKATLSRAYAAAKARAAEVKIQCQEEEARRFEAQVKPLMAAGLSWVEMGERLGADPWALRDRCLRSGLVKGRARDHRVRHIGPKECRAMAEMLSTGKPATEVAAEFGIARPTMYAYLRESGIEPTQIPNRHKGGRPRKRCRPD